MKKMNRMVSAILLGAMCLVLLSACGGTQVKDPGFDKVVANIDAAFEKSASMIAVDEDYIAGSLRMESDDYTDFCVKINAYGANVDEYGVFRGKDEAQCKELQAAAEAYLQLRIDSWMDAYMPEEKPKVTSAEVVTKGNYVCYTILSEADRATVEKAFEDSFAG